MPNVRPILKHRGAAVLLTVLLATAVQADDQSVIVAPFEVVEGYPGCTEPGKIAYHVAFETRAKARFGIAGAEFPMTCTLGTRKGGVLTEQKIDCPASEPDPETKALLGKFPDTIDISAEVTGCLGVTSHKFLAANWHTSAETAFGHYEDRGNLESAGLTIIFEGTSSESRPGIPHSGIEVVLGGSRSTDLPLLGLVFDVMEVSLPSTTGHQFSVTSFAVVAPETPVEEWCYPDRCVEHPILADWIMRSMRMGRYHKIVDYLESE